MRVAYVCADRGVPVFGRKGCSVHVQAILRAFLRRGFDVDLFAARSGGDPPPDLRGLRVHRVDASGGGGQGHSCESSKGLNGALRAALDASGERYALVYERHALWSSSAMEWARNRGIPGILEINAPLVDEQRKHRRLENPERARLVASDVLHAATLRVAVSMQVAVQHWEYGIPPDGFLICPNGVDPDRFPRANRRNDPGPPGQPFTIGFLGTLKPWHGLEVLLDAFCMLARRDAGYRLLVVGDGPQREAVEARLEAEGLSDRATLTGLVDPSEVPGWLAKMNVGTAPYADAAGLYFSPLKIVEYMAAGLPVVASRAGQIEELIEDEGSGLLVEAGDASALARALER
ncbi:MAG TPA: glycosyltransferase family 1 protein, partial [Deltaproteobacteria bacterium]|nr:glycosyltransferase family 1 protein [Deltaproteobacteria bacterium]